MTSPTPPTPRDYQIDLVERCRARARDGVKRIVIQAPTGSGKTLVTSMIIRNAVQRGKRALFLAHRRSLILQKSRKLAEFGVEHGVLMNGHATAPHLPVQVASRDTLLSRAFRHDWISPPPADVVIIDEAHHAMSDGYQALLECYPDAYHFGPTATPARDDGRGLGDFYEALECSVPISTLIAQGHLVGVKCFAPQNYGKRCISRRKLSGDPVSTWLRLAEGRPTVLFASRVTASRACCDAFNTAGIPAEHMDDDTPDEEREAIIARVEAGFTKVLCNVGVMTEGVDVPCLSCVILLRLAGSYVVFAQAVGRVMRPFPGKDEALLIDHSDAVLEHGFPDEDVRWELAESDTVGRRNKADRDSGKRSQPIACPRCGALYAAAAVCPDCGYKLPRRLQPAAVKNQLLTEVEKALTPEERRATHLRYWHTCLFVMAHKGRTLGAARQMYRSRYKEWPPPDFPNAGGPALCKRMVADLYPQYLERE